MRIFTIGFAKSSAEQFFGRLAAAGVRRVVDVRLANRSQLAGFAKRGDLEYFLVRLCGIAYEHRPELAPTQEMLATFRKRRGSWDTYREQFLRLVAARRIEQVLSPEQLDGACLLCSEPAPAHCHRSLVAEYLRQQWGGVQIGHL